MPKRDSSNTKAAYDRKYYIKNREKILKRSTAYHKKHRALKNARQQRYYHTKGKWSRVPGWTKARFDEFHNLQSGRCAICDSSSGDIMLCRDHNHETQQPR